MADLRIGAERDSAEIVALLKRLVQLAEEPDSHQSTFDWDYIVWKRTAAGLAGFDVRIVRKEGEFLKDWMERLRLAVVELEKQRNKSITPEAIHHYKTTRRHSPKGISKDESDLNYIMGD